MRPQSITQDRGPSPPPNLVAQNALLNFNQDRDHRIANFNLLQQQYDQQFVLPLRVSPSRRDVSIFEPFRNHMHMESGNTILVLDDGTNIDMGTNSIDEALKLLSKLTYSNGVVTYTVRGFTPEIEMIILPNGHIILRHPHPPPQLAKAPPAPALPPHPHPPPHPPHIFTRKQKKGGRRRTRARKMGRLRLGTNKCRRQRRGNTRHLRRT
jgi:hypothetical protein